MPSKNNVYENEEQKCGFLRWIGELRLFVNLWIGICAGQWKMGWRTLKRMIIRAKKVKSRITPSRCLWLKFNKSQRYFTREQYTYSENYAYWKKSDGGFIRRQLIFRWLVSRQNLSSTKLDKGLHGDIPRAFVRDRLDYTSPINISKEAYYCETCR